MATPSRKNVSLADLETEHRDLADHVGGLRQWWEECRELGQPRFGEMGHRVENLTERLAEHFALEEAGGYLQAVCVASPEHRGLVFALERQHDDLLNALRRFAGELRRSEPPFECWSEAGTEFDALVSRLVDHERAETDLIEHVDAMPAGSTRRSPEVTGALR